MCRFTARVGPSRPLDGLVYGGSHPLLEQAWAPRELLQGTVNADGWGVAWYAGGRPVRLGSARPVWQEEHLQRLLAATDGAVAVAALRNATPGLPVDEASVPPLVADRWAFVLNGFVPAFRERHARPLRDDLPDDLYARLRGASDAETLFLMAVDALRRGASRAEALAGVAAKVLARVDDGAECQLGMLLADPDGISVRMDANVGRTNSLHLLEGAGLAAGGALLASEALDDDPSWRRLPDHARVEADGGGARVTAG